MSTAFERFGLMESVAIPMAVVLSAMIHDDDRFLGVTEIGENDRERGRLFGCRDVQYSSLRSDWRLAGP